MRFKLKFNEYDNVFDVERTSCMGPYQVENGLPINPKNKSGNIGRGSLRFWGPNHAILALLVKFKKTPNGSFMLDSKNQKILQVLVCLKNEKEYELPQVSNFCKN